MAPLVPELRTDGWVSLGVVGRPHGIKGTCHFHPWNAAGETLRAGLDVQVGRELRRVARYAASLLSFEGVASREDAAALQGREVFARRDDFVDKDELFLVDLVGAPVRDVHGRSLGLVAALSDNGAQPLLVVRRDGTDEEVLVPFVPAIVRDASPTAVVLAPPAGLFDEAEAIEARDHADAAPDGDAER
jgi:16S rRNA processing protein RimM